MKHKYPPRKSYHCISIVRSLFDTGENARLGAKATLLVIKVAETEDRFHYRGPVNFWNSQLMQVLGMTSRDKLNTVRQKAIDAGWLVYSRKNDREVGVYWTLNPYEAPPSGDTNRDANGDRSRDTNGDRSRDTNGDTSIPFKPNTYKPKPCMPTATQANRDAPSIEEVRKYADAWSKSDEADDLPVPPSKCVDVFFDHFKSLGWESKGNPIRDWQAAFRNWVRRQKPAGRSRVDLGI